MKMLILLYQGWKKECKELEQEATNDFTMGTLPYFLMKVILPLCVAGFLFSMFMLISAVLRAYMV
jgi:hypothetical protein